MAGMTSKRMFLSIHLFGREIVESLDESHERIRTAVECEWKRNLTICSFLFLAAVFLSVFPAAVSVAKETEGAPDKEIVLVLDCSKSMENVDSQYLAFDFFKNLAAVLPRDYHVGMVAFNNEICASVPINSSYLEIESALEGKTYTNYGNAGAGLAEAVAMFGSGEADKKIILVSDGEIMMKTDESTQESVNLFGQAVRDAQSKGIPIDVIALGQRIEEGYTVYQAAGDTGGKLYELADGDELGNFAWNLLFDEWKLNASHVGKMDGTDGELTVRLPDRFMSNAKLILLGEQQNDNMTVNCEAVSIDLLKGKKYTVIEMQDPGSEEIKIQMHSDTSMKINAYLTAEYDYYFNVDHTYDPESNNADFKLSIMNHRGQNLLEGALKDKAVEIYLGNEKQEYHIQDGKIRILKGYGETSRETFKVDFGKSYGNYYGSPEETVTVEVPVQEDEREEIDWFFWLTIAGFAISLLVLFLVYYKHGRKNYNRRKVIDETGLLQEEKPGRRNEWGGKLQVYVIRNREDIDFPPESINLFARCSRDMITLEWILDTCNLPITLDGAEKIILRPGDDRSLTIRNSSRAAVLLGRELLAKGHSYHLYYGEKVTFIFDREDTEIEVHYRDLKPNERQGR